jgi:putative membrane protein
MLTRDLRVLPITRLLLPHIVGFSLWAALVVIFHTMGHHPERFGVEPGLFHQYAQLMYWSDVGIPFSAIAALGGALAIFLGFRNNAAYDRWWEARKVWGGLVNDSRSWTRNVMAWVQAPPGGDPDSARALQVELIHRHLAFVHGLAFHLRKQRNGLLGAVARFVPDQEAERYNEVPNVITALLIEQGCRVAQARDQGHIEHFRHLSMDQLLTRLSDIQGKCERIKNTPLPRQYDAFPRWFVYFYGLMLPFGLVSPIGWGAVPVSVSITIIFLALEVSGRTIENPFEGDVMDTPMTALAITIERDMRAALGEALPEPAQPNDYGILM